MMARNATVVVALVGLTLGSAVGTAHSSTAWRSTSLSSGWQVAGRAVTFDRRGEGSIIATEAVCEQSGEIGLEFQQNYGPWARLELRFRSAGDEQTYAAAVLEPEQRRICLVRKHEGRFVAVPEGAARVGPLPAGSHRLGYRFEGRSLVISLDGQDLLRADSKGLPTSGRIGLAAAFAHVRIEGPDIQTAPPGTPDDSDRVDEWRVLYGPTAWHAAPEAEGPAPGQSVTVFAAGADGAVVGDRECTHFAVELKGRFTEASSPYACFGLRPKVSADAGSYYVAEVRGNQSRLIFTRVTAGQRDMEVTRDLPLPPIELNRWYTLRCVFQGDRVTVEVDGERHVDLVDPRPLEKGRTAVSASYATVQVAGLRHEPVDSDYRFPTSEPPAKPYDPGPALPATSADGDEDDAYWYLPARGLRVAIHKATGTIGGLWRPSGAGRLADRVVEMYKLETRSDAVAADGYGDCVRRVVRRARRGLTVECTNPRLQGIVIEKTYRLDPRNGILAQTITFTNETDRPDLFLTYALRTVLAPAYREQAVYTGGSYLGPLVPAKSVRERTLTDAHKLPWTTGITNGRPSWVLAINDALGCNLATYRYRVNGQYVLPWNSIWTEDLLNLYHTPAGWEMGVCTLHLAPEEAASAEVDYTLGRGGRLSFYDDYRERHEVAAMYDRVGPRPTWLRDIKMPVPDTVARAVALTEDGVLVRLDSPFSLWGDPLARGADGELTQRAERVAELVRRSQEASPRVRAGLYTWAWTASEKSPIVRRHPEWFIARDKAGELRNAYPMAMSFLRCLAAPGCLQERLDWYHNLVRTYSEDLQYLDNDGTGVQIIDWEHLRVDQDYDWQRLHEGVLSAARAHTPQTATFFNNRVIPQGDISFAEYMPAEVQNEDWRRPADEMYPLKVFQKRDPERVVSLLYSRPDTEPSYTNYCVGLGLLPWYGSLAQLPFVNAAIETRRMEVMDADLRPDWQTDPSTPVEAYPLRQGAAACICFIGHDDTPRETDISFSAAAMGLLPGEPYTAWLFDLKDYREHQGRLTETDQRIAYQECNWADETVVAGRFLMAGDSLPQRCGHRLVARPRRLRMLMVTQAPALLWSLNGRRTNFWLPEMRGVRVGAASRPDADRLQFTCSSDADRAEIAIPIPRHHSVSELAIDGTKVSWTHELAGGAWVARVAVPQGRHLVSIGYSRRERVPQVHDVALRSPQSVRAGEVLPVDVSFRTEDRSPDDDALLRVLQGGIQIAGATSKHLGDGVARFELPVPGSARPGLYDLAFDIAGAPEGDVAGRVEVLPGSWRAPLLPGDAAAGMPAVKVSEVNRTVNGLRVLRAGTDTFDHRGGVQLAELDPETLRLRCGLRDDAESPWGYGFCGIEVRDAGAIAVEMSNTFAEFVGDGNELGDRYLDSFAGLMIDYHTAGGYTKRVALGLGALNAARPVVAPNWGKAAPPDECHAWSRTLVEKATDRLTLDLAQYAPPDWDGRAWFSVGVDTVSRGLQIEARLSAAEGR